jgi:hypothetical protein
VPGPGDFEPEDEPEKVEALPWNEAAEAAIADMTRTMTEARTAMWKKERTACQIAVATLADQAAGLLEDLRNLN